MGGIQGIGAHVTSPSIKEHCLEGMSVTALNPLTYSTFTQAPTCLVWEYTHPLTSMQVPWCQRYFIQMDTSWPVACSGLAILRVNFLIICPKSLSYFPQLDPPLHATGIDPQGKCDHHKCNTKHNENSRTLHKTIYLPIQVSLHTQ